MTVLETPAAPDATSTLVLDVEVTRTLPDLTREVARPSVTAAWILLRCADEPVGSVLLPAADVAGPDVLATALLRDLGSALGDVLVRNGLDRALAGTLTAAGLDLPGPHPFTQRRRAVLADAGPVTAVVCTRSNPDGLARTLTSLTAQTHPDVRILVVDNASVDDSATGVVERARALAGPGVRVDLVREPRPGLSRARNTALRTLTATDPDDGVVAWLDDDEIADPHWLAEIARAFADHPAAAAVTGVVVPAELRSHAQLLFEEFGGHSKGRGFTPAVLDPADPAGQHPLFPLPAFGVGANMAFRRSALLDIGGFDPLLGAGTRTSASEDTDAFARVMLRGGTVVYHPAAITRHRHREDLEKFAGQLQGYGKGLTAFYTGLVLDHPGTVRDLLALAPQALRAVGGDGERTSGWSEEFPPEVVRANLRGMLTGPGAYLRSRLGRTAVRPAGTARPAPRRAVVVVPSLFARARGLRTCVDSLLALDHADVHVVVVDNRVGSPDRSVWTTVEGPRVTVVAQPVPGISAARNRGVAVARDLGADVVAFTDDDVSVAPDWLTRLTDRFAAEPDLDLLGGRVDPADLDTSAARTFEEFTHGSGGAQDTATTVRLVHPAASTLSRKRFQRSDGTWVYEFGDFMGANMAVRTDVLRALGGFDEALGAGTRTRGGEDIDLLLRVLEAGGSVGYEPTALVRHTHRDTDDDLRSQVEGYGRGFTAVLAAAVLRDPRHAVGLGRTLTAKATDRAAAVVRARLSPSSTPDAAPVEAAPTLHAGLSAGLARTQVLGMLRGPVEYVRARREHPAPSGRRLPAHLSLRG